MRNVRERESLIDVECLKNTALKKRETKRSITLMSEFLALRQNKLLYKYKLIAILQWLLHSLAKQDKEMPIMTRCNASCIINKTVNSSE